MNNLFVRNTVVATLTNGVPIERKGERNAKFLDVYMKVHIFLVDNKYRIILGSEFLTVRVNSKQSKRTKKKLTTIRHIQIRQQENLNVKLNASTRAKHMFHGCANLAISPTVQ